MTRAYEPMSPSRVEEHLRSCVTELTKAEKQVAESRDVETDAEVEFRSAHRRAMLSPECPKVERGGTTTAERDAWVDAQCAEEWATYRRATAAREAAVDHSRTVRDVTSAYQSISSLTRAAFSLAGDRS